MSSKKEYMREWRKSHPLTEEQKTHHREHNRKYMQQYRKIHPKQSTEYYKQHPEKRKEHDKQYYQNHKIIMGCYQKERMKNMKFSVFAIYSEGTPKCTCCGETEISFLTIDHINNDGAKQRRELFKKHIIGNTFYHWLIKNNFPEGYQVLCMNCQFGKKCNDGICPHVNKII